MKLSRLQWVDLSFNNDNPYDQTRMFCDIRLVFFEKRRYWMAILALCSARDAPSIIRRYNEQLDRQSSTGTVPKSTGNKNLCHLCMLPKDLIKLVATMAYPWPRTEKMMLGFIH